MVFEYDDLKNEANIIKHKVSFEEAQTIWSDPDMVVLPARKHGEKRMLAIGEAYTACYSVVHTKRGEAIRIISARRATRKEAQLYEAAKRNR